MPSMPPVRPASPDALDAAYPRTEAITEARRDSRLIRCPEALSDAAAADASDAAS